MFKFFAKKNPGGHTHILLVSAAVEAHDVFVWLAVIDGIIEFIAL